MIGDEKNLTIEQKELLYLISRLTDSFNNPTTWVKETPLQAFILYAIKKGLFKEYDYAPISTSFLGQGRKFVNISKEGEDDLGDLRELNLLETIRLSSSKHEYITGYRPTEYSEKIISNINAEIKKRIDDLFICPECQKTGLKLIIDLQKSDFSMHCNNCKFYDVIPLVIPEDVSYSTKAYFFTSLEKSKSNRGMEK